MNERFGILTLAWMLITLVSNTEATIRILESGKDFPSWPDTSLGKQLDDDQVYEARLQLLKGNAHLCYSPSEFHNWNVTIPEDGLPVALLVKKGICGLKTKVEHAKKYIHPPGVVQFLIIDGVHMILNDENADSEEYVPGIHHGYSTELESEERKVSWLDPLSTSPSSFDIVSRFPRKNQGSRTGDTEVSVLHVTFTTGYSLLEIINREVLSVHTTGGTILELTSEAPNGRAEKLRKIWIILFILFSMAGCLYLLGTISSIVEAGETTQEQPHRPRRRRLTPWQVRKMFPFGVFDGSVLHFPPERPKQHYDGNSVESDNLIASIEEDKPVVLPRSITVVEETCTICLDDYTSGDKLRCLPCQHMFHSKCIAKWLTERSATCPLCKTDVYESDNEEEEEDDGPNQPSDIPLASSWSSVPPEALVTPPEQNTTHLIRGEVVRRERSLGSWIGSIFRRLRSQSGRNAAAASSLSEPLLSNNPDEQHESQDSSASVTTSMGILEEGTANNTGDVGTCLG